MLSRKIVYGVCQCLFLANNYLIYHRSSKYVFTLGLKYQKLKCDLNNCTTPSPLLIFAYTVDLANICVVVQDKLRYLVLTVVIVYLEVQDDNLLYSDILLYLGTDWSSLLIGYILVNDYI